MLFRLILFIFFVSPILTFAEDCDVIWAKSILSCSSDTNSSNRYAPNRILGKYNIMPNQGKSLGSWSVPYGVRRMQHILLDFGGAYQSTQMVVAENFNPGALARVTLYNKFGKSKVIYDDPKPVPLNITGRFLNLFFDQYEVSTVKLEFNTTNFLEEYQIDAVGLSNCRDTITPKINVIPDAITEFKPEPVSIVNSDFSELAPIITPDGRTLYFTREGHPGNIGPDKQQDVWFADIDENGNFSTPKNIGAPINNQYNNFAISVTPDNNSLLLGNIYRWNQNPLPGLSISNRVAEGWGFPEKLNILDYQSKSRYNSYSLGSDGKTLLLSIVSEPTYGDHDLYVSFMFSDGTWSKPMNLGPTINTPCNEESPFLAPDGKTLYFSGNGYPGYGKNDIFVTRRLDNTWTNWSEPLNIGPTINTPEWDAYFSTTAAGDYAYFVSSDNEAGAEDIYRIQLPQSAKPTSVQLISGRVLNAKTKLPLSAKISYEILPSGEEVGIARSNAITGEYKIALPTGKKYGFSASCDGFYSINENIDLTSNLVEKEIKKDILMVPIVVGETIKINNIFFEFGKYELLPDSYPELNRLLKLMQEKPKLKIRIEGHTDNIGSDKSNNELSANRANAVSQYLIDKGIDADRIKVVGYGKTKPIADNRTEEGRQLNRRVEFVIVEE